MTNSSNELSEEPEEDGSNLVAGRTVTSFWISHRHADQKFIAKAKGSHFK